MSNSNNNLVRSLHDLGLGAWFGGSLMGAVGVNGAANDVHDPADRLRAATAGWGRWAPVNAAAIGAHLIGAVGMLWANQDRVRTQKGVGASSAIKTALTVASLGATAYAGVLGARTAKDLGAPVEGGVKPSPATPENTASAQKQLRAVQWVLPLLTGALTVVSAVQGEQQKPTGQLGGLARSIEDRLSRVAA
jgi:hypothetical protein